MTTGRMKRLLLLVLTTAVTVGGCATVRRHEAKDTGDMLVAAGFRPKPADTPERERHLRAMQPLKLVSDSKDGKLVYRYADPYSCDCLYVGDEQAYTEYKRLALQKRIADDQLAAAEAEENASMDWGLWGPWWW